MVIRFLFCLTGSLLSGSAVAVLFSALVQNFFPDTPHYQTPASIALATPQDRLPERIPRMAEQSTRPPHSAVLTTGILEPAKRSDIPAAGQQPEPAALAQAGAQSKEELLSASATADLLTQDTRKAGEATTPPTHPTPQYEMTRGMHVIAEASSKGQNPEPDSANRQESPENKATSAAEAPARATKGSRPTRGRSVSHVSRANHAHRRQSNHPLIRQAQREVQE